MDKIKHDDIKAVMELFDKSQWRELSLQMEGLNLYLSKDPVSSDRRPTPVADFTATATAPSESTKQEPVAESAPANKDQTAEVVPEGMVVVRAANLGTFYRSPKPGADPYVQVGQEVEAETEVGLIEVMKLFTPVAAGVSGTIRKICVEDGDLVEHDQALIYIEPNN